MLGWSYLPPPLPFSNLQKVCEGGGVGRHFLLKQPYIPTYSHRSCDKIAERMWVRLKKKLFPPPPPPPHPFPSFGLASRAPAAPRRCISRCVKKSMSSRDTKLCSAPIPPYSVQYTIDSAPEKNRKKKHRSGVRISNKKNLKMSTTPVDNL